MADDTGCNGEITIIVPTLNEERHVARAVRSCRTLGHVFVVDSLSVDRTAAIASGLGATVVEHEWQGYSDQKNWALANLPIGTEWVMFLDADEWISERLGAEIRDATRAGLDGYWIPRVTFFLGRRLRHATSYPDYQLRLFRRHRGRFESRLVHEHVVVEGSVGFLRTPLSHENLNGMDDFVRRHRRYAQLEAAQLVGERRGGALVGQRRGSFLGSWPDRRRALKRHIWYRIPGRPLVRFLWMYGIKRGFRDGREGLAYSKLLASYEAMIDEEIRTLEIKGRRVSGRPEGVSRAD